MQIQVQVGNTELRQMLVQRIQELMQVNVDPASIKIEVKSKQNYRAEWEDAEVRARLEVFDVSV